MTTGHTVACQRGCAHVGTVREQLATALKEARLAGGFDSQGKLATRLHVSRAVINKAESANQAVPSDALLMAWAETTGADLAGLLNLAQRAKSGTPEWFLPFKAREAGASILRYWSPLVVPGIGQTTAYMRALFNDEGHPVDKVDELTAARLDRQSVIGRVPITMIIGHHVLYRLVASPTVMAAQCSHLTRLAEQSGVAVHVLPEGLNMGVYGAFQIATGDDGAATVLMEGVEDITSTEPGLLSKASVAFERLLGAAAPRGDSLGTIRTAEGSWKSQA